MNNFEGAQRSRVELLLEMVSPFDSFDDTDDSFLISPTLDRVKSDADDQDEHPLTATAIAAINCGKGLDTHTNANDSILETSILAVKAASTEKSFSCALVSTPEKLKFDYATAMDELEFLAPTPVMTSRNDQSFKIHVQQAIYKNDEQPKNEEEEVLQSMSPCDRLDAPDCNLSPTMKNSNSNLSLHSKPLMSPLIGLDDPSITAQSHSSGSSVFRHPFICTSNSGESLGLELNIGRPLDESYDVTDSIHLSGIDVKFCNGCDNQLVENSDLSMEVDKRSADVNCDGLLLVESSRVERVNINFCVAGNSTNEFEATNDCGHDDVTTFRASDKLLDKESLALHSTSKGNHVGSRPWDVIESDDSDESTSAQHRQSGYVEMMNESIASYFSNRGEGVPSQHNAAISDSLELSTDLHASLVESSSELIPSVESSIDKKVQQELHRQSKEKSLFDNDTDHECVALGEDPSSIDCFEQENRIVDISPSNAKEDFQDDTPNSHETLSKESTDQDPLKSEPILDPYHASSPRKFEVCPGVRSTISGSISLGAAAKQGASASECGSYLDMVCDISTKDAVDQMSGSIDSSPPISAVVCAIKSMVEDQQPAAVVGLHGSEFQNDPKTLCEKGNCINHSLEWESIQDNDFTETSLAKRTLGSFSSALSPIFESPSQQIITYDREDSSSTQLTNCAGVGFSNIAKNAVESRDSIAHSSNCESICNILSQQQARNNYGGGHDDLFWSLPDIFSTRLEDITSKEEPAEGEVDQIKNSSESSKGITHEEPSSFQTDSLTNFSSYQQNFNSASSSFLERLREGAELRKREVTRGRHSMERKEQILSEEKNLRARQISSNNAKRCMIAPLQSISEGSPLRSSLIDFSMKNSMIVSGRELLGREIHPTRPNHLSVASCTMTSAVVQGAKRKSDAVFRPLQVQNKSCATSLALDTKPPKRLLSGKDASSVKEMSLRKQIQEEEAKIRRDSSFKARPLPMTTRIKNFEPLVGEKLIRENAAVYRGKENIAFIPHSLHRAEERKKYDIARAEREKQRQREITEQRKQLINQTKAEINQLKKFLR